MTDREQAVQEITGIFERYAHLSNRRQEINALAEALLRWRADGQEIGDGQIIRERDEAEEAISQAYCLVTGESPEWSNLFGFDEAVEDIKTTVERRIQTAIETERKACAASACEYCAVGNIPRRIPGYAGLTHELDSCGGRARCDAAAIWARGV